MAEPPKEKRFWAKIGGFVGAIASVIAIDSFFFSGPTPSPSKSVYETVTNEVDAPTDLSIIDADFEAEVETRRIFYIIPIRKIYYNIYHLTIRNEDRTVHSPCSVVFRFAGSQSQGHGVLFIGDWTGWLAGKEFLPGFTLPSDSTVTQDFFSEDIVSTWPLNWAQVRVVCQNPSSVSPWHNVDLSHTQWP